MDPSFTHATLSDLADPRYAGRVITTPTPAVTYPAMYPTGTSFTPPANLANAVPGQINTNDDRCGRPAGLNGGTIVIFYQFVLKSGYNFSLAWVNSVGAGEGRDRRGPGLISLAQYNNPAFPQATKDLAAAIGAGLYSLMDTLPPTSTC